MRMQCQYQVCRFCLIDWLVVSLCHVGSTGHIHCPCWLTTWVIWCMRLDAHPDIILDITLAALLISYYKAETVLNDA